MTTNKKPATTGRRAKRERRRLPAGRRRTDEQIDFAQADTANVVAGPLRIHDREKKVFVYGEEKQLTPKEYELLRLLCAHEGRVFTTGELGLNLWHDSQRANTEVKQYVYRLRKKIEPNPRKPRWIRNVKGFGYQLVIDEADTDTT